MKIIRGFIKATFFLLLIFCLAAMGVYYALNSSWVTQKFAGRVINRYAKDFEVQSIRLGRQKLVLPGKLWLEDVTLILSFQDEHYQLTAQKILLNGLEKFLTDQQSLIIQVDAMNVSSDAMNVQNLNGVAQIALDKGRIQDIKGKVTVEQGEMQSFKVKNIEFIVEGDSQKIRLVDLTAQGYGGQIKGEISLDYADNLPYSIRLDLVDIDLSQLKEINEAVFSQVDGMVNGQVNLKGDRETIHFLETDIKIPEAGKIKASLLGFIAQYIPGSKEKKQLESLIKADGMVDVETASLQMKSLSPEKVSGAIKLSSRQLNVDLNLPVDINLDGRFDSLIQYFGRLSH